MHKANPAIWFDYMDNLRALALLIGVFFHAAMAYNPMAVEFWPSTNEETSIVLTYFALFTHAFRMPLFMVISGFFAHLLLDRRGVNAFLKNRINRILFPFVVFLPIVLVSLIAGFLWALNFVESSSPFLELIAPVISDPKESAIPIPISTGHLWFLYNLILFCGLLALAWKTQHSKRQLAIKKQPII